MLDGRGGPSFFFFLRGYGWLFLVGRKALEMEVDFTR